MPNNPELLGPLDTRKPQEYGDLGRGGKAGVTSPWLDDLGLMVLA